MDTQPRPVAEGDEVRAADELRQKCAHLVQQLQGVIVGMDDVIEQLLVAMLCRGHAILEGVPGLAKTLLVSTVASMLGLSFRRIQFTPDLMPADITGSDVLEEDRSTGKRIFRFVKGPLFANIVLADEINRTPPKTQSALLEAMQEQHVTVGGETYKLQQPFFVLATQNPIEQEGTYPLPEAQLDRFMLKIHVDYPSEEHEIAIAKRATTDYSFATTPVLTAQEIETMQSVVRRVPVSDQVYAYAVGLVRRTRPQTGNGVAQLVGWGAGPRGSINLLLAAKARAVLHGRYHVTTNDVANMALPVLRHRIMLTFNAEAAGKKADDVIRSLLDREATHAPARGSKQEPFSQARV